MLGMTDGACTGSCTFSAVMFAIYGCNSSTDCMLGSIKQSSCVLLIKLMRVRVVRMEQKQQWLHECCCISAVHLQVCELEPCVTPCFPTSHAHQARSFTSKAHKWDTRLFVRSFVRSCICHQMKYFQCQMHTVPFLKKHAYLQPK